MAKIVILGAGLTGLSSAYHLEKNNFYDYKIFEQKDVIGGLCDSITTDGFTFDYTGHLLHISAPYFKNFLQETLNLDKLNLLTRHSYIYSKETFTHYPFQTNLYGLPVEVITECIEGFLKRNKSLKPKNFYDWVLKHFGYGIGKHFLFPYQTKLFSYDIKKILDNWTGRFVPSTSLKSIIKGAITPSEKKVGYNSTFYYPKHSGISLLPKSIAAKLTNKIHINHSAEIIDIKNKVITFNNGHKETYNKLITTLPLDILLEKTYSTRLNFNHKLLCNSVMNFNLGFNIDKLSDKHWIYFPEKKYSFYRIGFWKNFSQNMVKPNHSSIYGEFSYMPGKLSNKQMQNKINKSTKELVKILGITESNIVVRKNLLLKHAYVIYDSWRNKNLPLIHNRLSEENIFSVGRFGEWKYSSMQEAILDGKNIVEQLITTTPTIHLEKVYEKTL